MLTLGLFYFHKHWAPPPLHLTHTSLHQSTFATSLHTSASMTTPHAGLFVSHEKILLFYFSLFSFSISDSDIYQLHSCFISSNLSLNRKPTETDHNRNKPKPIDSQLF